MQQLTQDIYKRIIMGKVYIDNNFKESLELEQISRHACLSCFHFHRLFTRVYRKTPHQYLTLLRLQHAKALLEKEGISITEVCNSVGFDSLGSFSTLFKKQVGYAPRYYRNIAYLKKKLAEQKPISFVPHCFVDTYQLGQ